MGNLLSLESDATLTGSEVIYLVDGTDDKKATIDQVKDFVIAAIPPSPGGGQQTYTIEDWDIRKTETQEIVPIDSEFLASTLNPDGSETISLAPIDVTQQYLAQPTLSSGNNVVYLDGKIKINGDWGTPAGGIPYHYLGFSNIESIRVETGGSDGTEANWACDFQMILTQLTPEELVQTFINQEEPTTPYIVLAVTKNPSTGTFTWQFEYNGLGGLDSINLPVSDIVLKPSMDGFHFLGESIPVKAHPNYDPIKPWNAVFFLTNTDTTTYQYDIPVYKGFSDISITRLIPALPDGDLTIQFPSTGQDKQYYVLLLPELVPPEADINELVFNKLYTGNFVIFSELAPNTFGANVFPLGRPGQTPPLFSWGSSTTTGDHEIIYEKSTGSFYFGIIGDPSSRVEIYNESYLGPILSIAITPLNISVGGVPPVTLKTSGLERVVVLNGDLPVNAKDGQMYKTLNEGRWQDKLIAADSHISFYENLTKFIVIPSDDILQGLNLDYIQTKQRLIADVEALKTNQIGNYRGTFADRWAISNISYKKGDYVLIGSSESSLIVYHAIRDSGSEQYGPYYDFQILTGLDPDTITTDNIPEGSINRYYSDELVNSAIAANAAPLIPTDVLRWKLDTDILICQGMYEDAVIVDGINSLFYTTPSGILLPEIGNMHVQVSTRQANGLFSNSTQNVFIYDFYIQQSSNNAGGSLRTGLIFRNTIGDSNKFTSHLLQFSMPVDGPLILTMYDHDGVYLGVRSLGYLEGPGTYRIAVDCQQKTIRVNKNLTTIVVIDLTSANLIDFIHNIDSSTVVETFFEVIYRAPDNSLSAYPKRLAIMEKIINI